jgi:hypothetical protein
VFILELLRKYPVIESLYKMGNSKCKGGSGVSEQTVLSQEERHCLHRLFESMSNDHSACYKEDLTVRIELRLDSV